MGWQDETLDAENEAELDDERRNEPRLDATLCVHYKSLDELVVAYTTDMSSGGLFVSTRDFIPVGSVVELEIELPDDGVTVRTLARVAHVVDTGERAGMGMEFLKRESGGIVDQLARYLTLRLGNGAEPAAAQAAYVLIVDDDRAYRDQAAMVMKRSGHRVAVAENGLEALGLVLRDPPDLIISDVQMPTMDGWQFLRLLRARPSVAHIPVIFLTMLSGEEERLKGYKLGVDDYISKPFLFEELSARVARVIARGSSAAMRNALRGDLAQVSVASMLQFIEIEKRTGLLLLVSRDEMATLHVREGAVVHVDFGAPCGELGIERLFRVIDWQEGRFELTAAEIAVEDSIGESSSYVLLEHARRQDEGE